MNGTPVLTDCGEKRGGQVNPMRMAVLGIAAAATVVTAVIAQGAGRGEAVTIAHASDRLPNRTATDWVTYADYAVVVTAMDDEEVPPAQDEIRRGEGLILRRVSLRVDDILWSSASANRPAPQSFTWLAFGWQFTDGSTSNRVQMAGDDRPRVEVGHSYIMAIEWQPAMCSPGDFVPGQWRGLGQDSTIPFDDQAIGQGEMEGQIQTVAQARGTAGPDDSESSLEDKLVGKRADALAAALEAASPGAKKNFGPSESEVSCS